MQTKDSNSRTSGAVNHPGADEWVAFLYGELPAATRRELGAHLAQCPNCAAQLQDWRDSMNALDQWALPAVRRPARQAVPALKWAAAAAVILLLGFAIGRQSSSAARADRAAGNATLPAASEPPLDKGPQLGALEPLPEGSLCQQWGRRLARCPNQVPGLPKRLEGPPGNSEAPDLSSLHSCHAFRRSKLPRILL